MIHWPRLLVFVACFTALVVSADAQQGRVLEGRTFHSDVLDREWAYTIYLPPGYDSSERAYPVFYLLHGLGGNHTGFVRSGSADMIADSLIAAAAIPPVILVMPDGSRSFWLDSDPVTGFGAVETALLQDLIPHVDEKYRTISTRGARMIAGTSMGGYGALRLAFRHPDLFGAVAALYPSIWRSFPAGPPAGDEPPSPAFGVPFDPARWEAETPWAFVPDLSAKAETVRLHVYLLAGDDDPFHQLLDGMMDLYLTLRDAGVSAELRIVDGGHGGEVKDVGLKETMIFFSDVFRRRRR